MPAEQIPTDAGAQPIALELTGVTFSRGDRQILHALDWKARAGERWVILGANGSGKTSLIRLAALYEHPSSGRLAVLGEELGRCDVRALRRRIGFVSPAFVDMIRPELLAVDVVMCALNAALEPWWHRYTDEDRQAAVEALSTLGLGDLAHRRFGTLSSGERQRVQLARTLMTQPQLLLFDEPTAGLDLLGRETFVDDLDALGRAGPMDRSSGASAPAPRAMVLVTHHLEEVPRSFTHALILRDGQVLTQGPIEDALTSEAFSEATGVRVTVERRGGRWSTQRIDRK